MLNHNTVPQDAYTGNNMTWSPPEPDDELAKVQARARLGRLGTWRCRLLGPGTLEQDIDMTTLGIVPYLVQWMIYWHGRGAAHQNDYYRCQGCHKIITWQHIRTGGCACGLSNRISPANLTAWEKVRLVVFPTWRLAQRWRTVPTQPTATLYGGGADE